MKKLISIIVAMAFAGIAGAQENNPYSKRGEDFIAAINLIAGEVTKGLVNEFSEEAINNYSGRLPIRNQVSVDMAALILQTIKGSGFDIIKFIGNSSLPDISKKILGKMIYSAGSSGREEFKKALAEWTEEIKATTLSAEHKEFILTMIAIAHNGERFSQALTNGREGRCYVNGPDGGGYVDGTTCVLLGAITGAWIGFEACGIWCMIGGAIVGGLIGGLS